MEKAREYRNNNASETVNTDKVRKPTTGFYIRVEDRIQFVDTTDVKDYGLRLKLTDVEETPNRLRHTKVHLVMKDGSVAPQGYILNIEGRLLAPEGMKWMWSDDIHDTPLQHRVYYAPTLGALLKFMQSQLHFTSFIY